MNVTRVYTTTYCPYCTRAKELLRAKGVMFEEIDVTGDDAARARLVELSGGQRTVPQIFIGALHVGGYSDLALLDGRGELDRLLAEAPDTAVG
ncbi:MAG: glutaredoxin 3 [Deltaproteobacteria bacterium]|nr:glutaredoxin 3 [Deltaproteobacteria bacterium]